MGFINITDFDKVFVVNEDTGEIVSTVSLNKKKTPLPSVFTDKAKYVGIDIKIPSECLIADQYFESVSQLDGMVGNKVKIYTEMIVDYVSEGLWNKNDVNIIKFLATKVVAHNRVFTTLKEVAEGTKIHQNHISRWFKEHKDVCRVINNRNGFVVDVHPSLVFKGSEEWREAKIYSWC